jgi:hypothetical protein
VLQFLLESAIQLSTNALHRFHIEPDHHYARFHINICLCTFTPQKAKLALPLARFSNFTLTAAPTAKNKLT